MRWKWELNSEGPFHPDCPSLSQPWSQSTNLLHMHPGHVQVSPLTIEFLVGARSPTIRVPWATWLMIMIRTTSTGVHGKSATFRRVQGSNRSTRSYNVACRGGPSSILLIPARWSKGLAKKWLAWMFLPTCNSQVIPGLLKVQTPPPPPSAVGWWRGSCLWIIEIGVGDRSKGTPQGSIGVSRWK